MNIKGLSQPVYLIRLMLIPVWGLSWFVNAGTVSDYSNERAGSADTFLQDKIMQLENMLLKYEAEGDIKGQVDGCFNLGSLFLESGEYGKSAGYLEKALEHTRSGAFIDEKAKILNNLGIVNEKTGSFNESVMYYLDAFEIYDSLGNTEGMASTANNLGVVYYVMGDRMKAARFYHIARSVELSRKDTSALLPILQNMGNIYFDAWDYDSASYYYQHCYDLARVTENYKAMGKSLHGLGIVELAHFNYLSAGDFFKKSLHYSSEAGDYQNMAMVFDNLGIVHRYQGSPGKAIAYFDSSLAMASERGLLQEQQMAHEHLAETYAEQQQFESAYHQLEQAGQLKDRFMMEKKHVAETETWFIKQKQENKILMLEKEKERKRAQLILLGSIIITLLVASVLIILLIRSNSKRHLEKAVSEQEKLRFKAVIEAQEKERKRIAGDLHDSVGQMLSLCKLNLSGIYDFLKKQDEEEQLIFNNSLKLIDDACQEVRDISHNLMPGALIRLGLDAALKELKRKVDDSGKIKVNLKSNLNGNRLGEKVEIALYRIVQEVFNNIQKHAGADMVDLSLVLSDDCLHVFIRDNGKGFDTGKIAKSSGIGWKNIYSRLDMINGRMEIWSKEGKGTNVEIKVMV